MNTKTPKLSNLPQKTKIIIVDDHKLFRMCLRGAFPQDHPDIQVVGEAESGVELFALLHSVKADLALLDIHLPDMDGIEIAQQLRKKYPEMKILAVSAENSADTLKRLLDLNIEGFISKQKSDPEELAKAIKSIMNGVEYFGNDISHIIYNVFIAKKRTANISSEFTEREKEIIHLCGKGLLCKEIADKLNISAYTVNAHKRNIFTKLGINNTMEMVQYAIKHGIIRVEE